MNKSAQTHHPQATKVAIVILNWNGRDLLRRFLPSVIAHSAIPGVEIIVADNGSTDDSLEILEKEFPSVTRLKLDHNYGFAAGYNEALKKIEAQYFVLLNSDVEVTRNWIEPVIQRLDQETAIAAVQPKILAYNEKHKFEYAGAAGGFIDKYGYPFCRGRLLNQIEDDKGQYDNQIDIFWASGACMFVRADLFLENGGFDIDFWAHMEEIDLCWRLKNEGYRITYVPESVVYHLGGGSLEYNNPRKIFLNFRNNLFLLYKNLPKGKLVPILFLRMLLDGLAAIKFLFGNEFSSFKAVFKAHIDFYSHLGDLHKKRMAMCREIRKTEHKEIYRGSMIFAFFLRNKKHFNQIWRG